MLEYEVKAVVADPGAVRARLIAAGGRPGFSGFMRDRRYDRDGELLQRDEVLRIRSYQSRSGVRSQLAWKGPVSQSGEGYKVRPELEYNVTGKADPSELLHALGYREVYAIDRYVEYYDFAGASARLEWYPHMDVLIEVEGEAEGIEGVIATSGIPRSEFLAEALPEFVARYERRTGEPAAVAEAELGGRLPSWAGQ